MTTWKIPFARPFLPPREEMNAALDDIWESRRLSNHGPWVERLEERMASITGQRCVAVSSCDLGLVIAVASWGEYMGPIDVSTFTFQSTINAILWNGGIPVLQDCDATGVLGARVNDKAIATRVFGNHLKCSALRMIVDAAHCVGTEAGPSADASVYSLSGTKIATGGEGGVIACRDERVYEFCRRARNYGFIGNYNAQHKGLNAKMGEIPAALAYLSLGYLTILQAKRDKIAAHYRERLINELEEIVGRVGVSETHQAVPVMLVNAHARARVQRALADSSIESKRYFLPLHWQPAYERFTGGATFPNADHIYETTLCLPIYHDMSTAEVDQVCDVILEAL